MKRSIQLGYDSISSHRGLEFHHVVPLLAREMQLVLSWLTDCLSGTVSTSPAVLWPCFLCTHSLGKEITQESTAMRAPSERVQYSFLYWKLCYVAIIKVLKRPGLSALGRHWPYLFSLASHHLDPSQAVCWTDIKKNVASGTILVNIVK